MNQITAEELADRIDSGESFALVDTRPADSFEAWHIEGAENVPYDPRKGLDDEGRRRVAELADGKPVVAICRKGLTSTPFAFEIESDDREVTVVEGGMEDWSQVYEVVPIVDREDLVVRQVQRRGKGCLGYVVGDPSEGAGAAVDATRQTDAFVVAAAEAGLSIERVLDTHVHADHISGGPRLADRLGVPYHLGEGAAERGVEYDFSPLSDGETLDVGGAELAAIHVPGHTSELLAYLIDGEYLLSSDALFVESVGRTELQFGDADAEKGARTLYESLHDKLLTLPDDTVVLPGHVSVTSDGRYEGGSPGEPIQARLGELRERLDLLGLDEEAFVDRLVENAPEKPPNYEDVIGINLGREPTPGETEATELELGPNNCAA